MENTTSNNPFYGGHDLPSTNNSEYDAELQSLERLWRSVRLTICLGFYPVIATIGITANVINIIVLTRKWMLSSTNYYLRVVALLDILYLVNNQILSLMVTETMTTIKVYMYCVPFLFGFAGVWSNATTWLTCTFTIERYIAISYPMLGRKVCTRERAFWIIIVVTTVSTALSMPEFFTREIIAIPSQTNATTVVYRTNKTAFANALRDIGMGHVTNTLFIYLPVFLLCFFNYQLIRSVILASRIRYKMAGNGSESGDFTNQSQSLVVVGGAGGGSGVQLDDRRTRQASEQQRITIMLITVVVAFCLCQIPSVTQSTFSYFNPEVPLTTRVKMKILSNFSNLLLVISAALNFFLYSCFSTKFRRTFQRVFCRCLMPAGSPGFQMMYYNSRGIQQNATIQPPQPTIVQICSERNKR